VRADDVLHCLPWTPLHLLLSSSSDVMCSLRYGARSIWRDHVTTFEWEGPTGSASVTVPCNFSCADYDCPVNHFGQRLQGQHSVRDKTLNPPHECGKAGAGGSHPGATAGAVETEPRQRGQSWSPIANAKANCKSNC
jgi:hypothetical protein